MPEITSEAVCLSSLIVGGFSLWFSGITQVFWLIALIFATALLVSIQKRLR